MLCMDMRMLHAHAHVVLIDAIPLPPKVRTEAALAHAVGDRGAHFAKKVHMYTGGAVNVHMHMCMYMLYMHMCMCMHMLCMPCAC